MLNLSLNLFPNNYWKPCRKIKVWISNCYTKPQNLIHCTFYIYIHYGVWKSLTVTQIFCWILATYQMGLDPICFYPDCFRIYIWPNQDLHLSESTCDFRSWETWHYWSEAKDVLKRKKSTKDFIRTFLTINPSHVWSHCDAKIYNIYIPHSTSYALTITMWDFLNSLFCIQCNFF